MPISEDAFIKAVVQASVAESDYLPTSPEPQTALKMLNQIENRLLELTSSQ